MLHPTTKKLVKAAFQGKSCTSCGHPAQRLRKEAYYCEDCLPRRRQPPSIITRIVSEPRGLSA